MHQLVDQKLVPQMYTIEASDRDYWLAVQTWQDAVLELFEAV